ncbi:MAG: HAD family hydrolase [Nannocystaceae bacterium]
MPALLDSYAALLLDMHRTFMFGVDRFGPGEDFAATYREHGGARLAPAAVEAAVRGALALLAERYADPRRAGDAPSVDEALRELAEVPASERPRLVEVIAAHEHGTIPEDARLAVLALCERRPVVVVSDLWAPPRRWEETLRAAGIWPRLAAAVFSSEIGAVKPHPRPFEVALARLGVAPGEALMIGDSYERDVLGATALGVDAVWIDAAASAGARPFAPARAAVAHLAEVLTLRGPCVP